ncbi:cupredoxin domain-containing protein [Halorussus sp. AFM4]|uniref:cupredoxin domain-containing protein n=1 Tax=Halorussus sp. AFM4 TaxID=3421651 RepID=UPI003EB70009
MNPTLNLQPGKRYEITWKNLDGAPHNFAILSQDGTVLKKTEIVSERGATQTLTFTATEKMDEYLCQVHPNSMHGQIALGGSGQTTQAATRLYMAGRDGGLLLVLAVQHEQHHFAVRGRCRLPEHHEAEEDIQKASAGDAEALAARTPAHQKPEPEYGPIHRGRPALHLEAGVPVQHRPINPHDSSSEEGLPSRRGNICGWGRDSRYEIMHRVMDCFGEKNEVGQRQAGAYIELLLPV